MLILYTFQQVYDKTIYECLTKRIHMNEKIYTLTKLEDNKTKLHDLCFIFFKTHCYIFVLVIFLLMFWTKKNNDAQHLFCIYIRFNR